MRHFCIMKKTATLFAFSLLISGLKGQAQTPANQNTPASLYNIAQKIPLSGDGSWDLITLDETNGMLYVSHENQVNVIDSRTRKSVGVIPGTKGVHGIAVAPKLHKGFTSNGKDTSVTVFSLDNFKVLKRIKVTGLKPDMILFDSFTSRVFVFNGKTKNVTVINADSDKVISTIALTGKPELAVSDTKGRLFLNLEDKSEVCVINSSSLKVEKSWPIAPGKEATGIAMDMEHHRLFIGCDNKMMVIMNSDNGTVIAAVPIGDKVDGVAYDPGLKRAYSSNGDGTLTVIKETDPNTFDLVENFKTQKGAKTLALNPVNHWLYLPVADYLPGSADDDDNPKAKPGIKPGTFGVIVVRLEE